MFKQSLNPLVFQKWAMVFCLMSMLLFPDLALAEVPAITSVKLNGQADSINFNARNGKAEPLLIEITANQAVKFNTIAICLIADSSCSRSTAAKYFTQTDLSSTVSKSWDGKTGGASPQVVADGEYKIVVTMALVSGGENTVQEITPHIIVLSADVDNGDNQNSTTTATTTNDTNSSVISGGGSYSAHSSQTDLSNYEESTPSIGAGRKRLAIVGSPVDFKVEQSRGANGISHYAWSFGDGTSAEGERVSHSYKFPGEYNVVLNGDWGDAQLVARTKVLVEEAKVAIAKIDQRSSFVEVVNNGQKEINLGRWVLHGATDIFLPIDTIIDPGKSIKIPLDPKTFTTTSSQLVLISADGYQVAKGKLPSIVELENKLSQLKEQLVALQSDSDQSLTVGEILTEGARNNSQKSSDKIITLAPKLSWWQKMFRIGK